MYIHQRWSAGATYGIIFYLLSNLKSTLHTTSDSGVDPGIFLGGMLTWKNWKKWPPRTYAEQKIDDFSFVFMHILKKLGKKIPHRDKSQVQGNQNWDICSIFFLNLTILWFVHRHFRFGLVLYKNEQLLVFNFQN